MKKQIFKLTCIYLLSILPKQINAQGCDDKGISTNPHSPVNTDPGKSTLLNQFYWFPSGGTPADNPFTGFYIQTGVGQTTGTFTNPWYTTGGGNPGGAGILGIHSNGAGSDFHPEDGWELIKFDNGYLADNTTQRDEPKEILYFCFYNRYTGIMRFFGMLPNSDDYKIIRFRIDLGSYKKNSSTKKLDYLPMELNGTNLLSIQGNAVQPLDQETEDVSIEVVTEYPGSNPAGNYFWFDVPLAYDPCICNEGLNHAISLSYKLEKTYNISIEGVSDMVMLQQTNSSPGTDYNQLVFNRIIGAAAATGVAIATKGAIIQTSSFIALLDIFTNKPGVSSANQANMEVLKNLLSNTSNFVYDEKEGKWKSIITNDSLSNKDWVEIFGGANKFITGMHDVKKPAQGGGKSTTTIVGNITATGTAEFVLPGDNMLYWGVPGSNLSKSLEEQEVKRKANGDVFDGTGTLAYYDPEYPLYNEILGTFALLRTPRINWRHDILELCDQTQPTVDPELPPFTIGVKTLHGKFTMQLANDFSYYFNPLTNVNLAKTKLMVAYVVSPAIGDVRFYNPDHILADPLNTHLTLCGDDLEETRKRATTINMKRNVLNEELTSPYVPIDQFKELVVTFTLNKDFSIGLVHTKIYIRFYIEYESHNLGKNGEPIRNTQVFTFPVELFDYELDYSPIVDVMKNDNGHNYNTPTFFPNSDFEFFNGLVTISSHLSYSGPGVKIIYSLTGFDLKPGAFISSNIKLVVGYPLATHEQPMQTPTFVDNFCKNQIPGLEYKAKEFAPAAIARMEEERDRRIMEQMIEEKQESTFVNAKAYPNPNNGEFNLLFDEEIQHNAQVTLYDLTGRVVHSQNISSGTTIQKINTQKLTPGIYMVTITQNDEKQSFKIVIE